MLSQLFPYSARIAGSKYYHYAWLIVMIAAVVEMVGAGLRAAFGVFIDPLVQEHGWSNSSIAIAYALSFIVTGFFSPVSDRLAGRFGARKTMLLGAGFFFVGMLGTAAISSIWHLYLAYSLALGIAQSLFLIPALPAVTIWFKRSLGIGTGVLWISWGLGPVAGVQIMSALINSYGWSTAFVTGGFAGTGVILFTMMFFRNSPADAGKKPFGWQEGDLDTISAEKASPIIRGKYVHHIRATNSFWNLINIHFLGCVGHAVILVMIVPMGIHKGLDANVAAGVLSTLAGVSLLTRFMLPIISDRIGSKPIMFVSYLLQGFTVLLLLGADSTLAFYVFAVAFAIGYGGEGTIFPVINRQYYGQAPQGPTIGWQLFGANLGMALGGVLGAFSFDLTGSYTTAIWLSAAFSIAGALSIALLQPTRRLLIPDWDKEPDNMRIVPEVPMESAAAGTAAGGD
ncbi:MAG: MFS transporter [Chloroflexi bacterium]|nr:MFS transporter [Chloroflexota bacterium]